MPDTDYNYTKYQKLNQENNNNPSKFYSHFLYKALIVTIFLVIVPLFPSKAPEFINQRLNTRGWEFLHLIFVGIAVSYGLFSRKNDDEQKDNSSNTKFDNAQSYVSRFLQVSSAFDDEGDSPYRPDANIFQTWNNQYCRNDPLVVVAEEYPAGNQEKRGSSSRIGEKPLLLPVRSLKSRVLDMDGNETSKESFSAISGSISRSNSNLGSKRFSSNSVNSRNGEFGGKNHQDLEDKLMDNVVLPSPIPWRSRSGKMETKERKDEAESPPFYSLPPSMEECEFSRSVRAQTSQSSRPDSTNSSPKLSPSPSLSSPKKFSPSPSFSAEAQGKSAGDFVRKKSINRSPPPPPPPPPQLIRKSRSMKPISSSIDEEVFPVKDFKRSLTSEPKDKNRYSSLPIPTSIRTTRSNDSHSAVKKDKEFNNVINTKPEKRVNEVEGGRKTVGFDHQTSFKTERQSRDRVSSMPQATFREFPKEEKEELVDKLVLESDEDLETEYEDEDDYDTVGTLLLPGAASSSKNQEPAASSNASDGGPDVDKKADEFIAKFREQIRLQRIESIKRCSGQINRKASR